MFKKFSLLAVFVLLLGSLSTHAAGAPPQPQMVGPHNVGALPHVGTLVFVEEDVQVAVYAIQDTANKAVVYFASDIAKIVVVMTEEDVDFFVKNTDGAWELSSQQAILASTYKEIRPKLDACTQKMGLD